MKREICLIGEIWYLMFMEWNASILAGANNKENKLGLRENGRLLETRTNRLITESNHRDMDVL